MAGIFPSQLRILLPFEDGAAAAVVLRGPGALSLDARLFGRREITIPEGSTPVSED